MKKKNTARLITRTAIERTAPTPELVVMIPELEMVMLPMMMMVITMMMSSMV